MSRWEDLHHEVFANTMTVDYTSVLGGEPHETSGCDQAKQWESFVARLTSWQHVTTFGVLGHCCAAVVETDMIDRSLLIELPQPGDRPVPEIAKVTANCSVAMRRDSTEGDKLTQNGVHLS